MLTRRNFVGSSIAVGAAVAAGAQPALAQAPTKRMIVDAQAHLWKASAPDYPWDAGVKPQLPEPFTYERALPLMDAAGIDRVVVVPPGLNDINTYALEAAAKHPTRFAVMGRIPIEDPEVGGTAAEVEGAAGHARRARDLQQSQASSAMLTERSAPTGSGRRPRRPDLPGHVPRVRPRRTCSGRSPRSTPGCR